MMYMLVSPMHFDIIDAPHAGLFTSLPAMIPFPQTINLQLLFYSIISESKLWCTLVVSIQNSQGHTDIHIKEMHV